jgi:phospholipase/carboxylesterase
MAARASAWYDIRSFERTSTEDAAGFRDTDVQVRQLIAHEIGRGIAAHRIVLAGFSQGGAVSLYTAPRLSERLAGVMALSCYLPLEGEFSAQRAAANDATPIFMAHGQEDQTLPISMGLESRDFLKNRGYTVEWHAYPMAHAVCAAEIADIREFLLRILP